MARNSSQEMESVAAIVHSYNWRKVVVIYEEDGYGDPGTLAQLSQALHDKGSDIEHRLVLPPHTSLFNPREFISEEVVKLLSKKSRVFIVLQSSILMANHLFREAKRIGLMDRDSVWIVTDSITSVLDSSDPSFVTSMEGAIGTKSYYSEETSAFIDSKSHFRETIRSNYPHEDDLVPGIHALRACDSITAISEAVTRLGRDGNTTSKTILKGLLSSDFQGLSGKIRLHDECFLDSSNLRIINIIGNSYKETGYWSSELGFLKNADQASGGALSMETLGSVVNWPGDLTRGPKGWTMPSRSTPLRIGVPSHAVFQKFVKIQPGDDNSGHVNKYTGFCIDVFYEVVNILEKSYPLPYEFITFNGTYNELVLSVADQRNESFDAAVGDITILANRSRYVEFTQPYAESGLSMLVQYKHEPSKAWLFLKPFSSSMWLFVVLILSSSYTASLSSMLTVERLEPKIKDIEWLRKTNATVGCDGGFVINYPKDVLRLENIKTIHRQSDYPSEFDKGSISAAFLELPYQKVFLEEYCNQYTTVGPTYKFGGFGFAFQKGSPIGRDVSEAILIISENGVLKSLERKWFPSSTNCSASTETDSLTIESFWGIYLISVITSTVCFLICVIKVLIHRVNRDQNQRNQETGDILAENGKWRKAIALVKYIRSNNRISHIRAPSSCRRESYKRFHILLRFLAR